MTAHQNVISHTPDIEATDVKFCVDLCSSSYTYKHIVQNLASCAGPLISIGLFLIMGDVWTVS